jgi:murein DD-endopeptidase MepM/ murein hydrolase activator NlpD
VASPRVLAVLIASTAYFAGCATVDQKFGDDAWYQKSKEVSGKAVAATETASAKAVAATETTAQKAYGRMQKYLAEKDLLKTFQDAGEHSETAVLGVLHKSGIAKGPGTTSGGTAAPAPGPGGTAPKKHTAPLPALGSAVPEEYSGGLRWPLDAGIVSSEFGARWGKTHKGLDIAADVGEPVYAIADGEVIYAGDGLRGYGNVVILRHDRKTSSLYAHNSELKVKQGDWVTQGTQIALLGSTGHSTGPHVHFEIRDNDTAVNPRELLPKTKFAGTVYVEPSSAMAANPPDPRHSPAL